MYTKHVNRIIIATALSIPIHSGAGEVDLVKILHHEVLLEQAKSDIGYLAPASRSDVPPCFPGRLDFSQIEILRNYSLEWTLDESLEIGKGISVLYGLRNANLPPLQIRQFVASDTSREAQEMLLLDFVVRGEKKRLRIDRSERLGDFALAEQDLSSPQNSNHYRFFGFSKRNIAFRIRGASSDLVRSIARELDRVICANMSRREPAGPGPELKTHLSDLTMANGETLRLPLEFTGSIEAPWKVEVRFVATPYAFHAVLLDGGTLYLDACGLGKARVGVCVYNSVTLESHWTVFDVDVTGPMNETQRSLFGDRN